MEIELKQTVVAQRLDDEGDPIGKLTTIQPGKYRLRSGLTQVDGEDGARAWLSPLQDPDKLYEARGLQAELY